eukprot:TRINITY_DN30398_c0_g1_i2.p3 TRINITY_DN30398_c0_g1~~TRINITY_DN30398_c0_g1_i2.p3  ORF type:complete len:123 (-),score=27.13 TRINITY_DN30398_c0_g1_i2:372-740(-)
MIGGDAVESDEEHQQQQQLAVEDNILTAETYNLLLGDDQPQQEMYDDMILDENDPEAEITQSDAWSVISAYFDEKGLVLQQLESFNEFISNKIQEIVEENGEMIVVPESQKNPGEEDATEKN